MGGKEDMVHDIAAGIENMVVKVHHVDAHVPKNRATEEQGET